MVCVCVDMYMTVCLRWIRLTHGHRLKEETEKKEYWFPQGNRKEGVDRVWSHK